MELLKAHPFCIAAVLGCLFLFVRAASREAAAKMWHRHCQTIQEESDGWKARYYRIKELRAKGRTL